MNSKVICGTALIALLSGGVLASVSMACAQAAPAAAQHAAFSTNSPLGDLLDNPKTKAVLQQLIPSMINNDQIEMARGMTLRQLQQYAGAVLTDEMLAKIDAELAKVK